jgi:hypothetical protein
LAFATGVVAQLFKKCLLPLTAGKHAFPQIHAFLGHAAMVGVAVVGRSVYNAVVGHSGLLALCPGHNVACHLRPVLVGKGMLQNAGVYTLSQFCLYGIYQLVEIGIGGGCH